MTQLGAELISSDEIAIYELVKNGFDACPETGSVDVSINYRISSAYLRDLQAEALDLKLREGSRTACPTTVVNEVLARLHALSTETPDRPFCLLTEDNLNSLRNRIANASTVGELLEILGRVNSIDIVDQGHGMTPAEVEKYYLTIGTTHRLDEVESIAAGAQTATVRLPSGEKGIGRLSAMRLGQSLEMLTLSRSDEHSVLVHIDWREFAHNRSKRVEDVPVDVVVKGERHARSGTYISIYDLTSEWPESRLKHLAANHLAKFIDPFPPNDPALMAAIPPRRVNLKWNGIPVESSEIVSRYLRSAQNSVSCRLSFDDSGRGSLDTTVHLGEVRTNPQRKIERRLTVVDFDKITDLDLRTIGPFEVQLYHFPRNRIKAIPHFASRSELKAWLDRWCGGLMLFRDGIRVLPYAAPDDDWLDLDGRALRGRGFRVNRIQVVGCVRISRLLNPSLNDQTNREGLRESPAFELLRTVVSRIIQQHFVSLLDEHLRSEAADVEHLALQVDREYQRFETCVEGIAHAASQRDWALVSASSVQLREVLGELQSLNRSVEKALEQKEANRIQVLELAATGMAAEAMAHDLEGVVQTAVFTLNDLAQVSTDKRIGDSVRHIRSVHQALLVQLKQISPGPARARRRARTFDLLPIIKEASSFYRERLTRHNIALTLPAGKSDFTVYAVEGHVRQILDNLFRNSIFWVLDTRRRFPEAPVPSITIECDYAARTVSFSDSGIGVAKEDADWIFQAFNSRREDGRGLGLHICKELAEFNRVRISLNVERINQWGRSNTFVLEFPQTETLS